MISTDDVKKLATLSRLSLSEEEITKLQGDIASILAYVDTIQKVELPKIPVGSPHSDLENVMRDDAAPIEPGTYTQVLLKEAPVREGDYLKVKKILG